MRTGLFIDKWSLTLDIPPVEHETVKIALKELADFGAPLDQVRGNASGLLKNYEEAYLLRFDPWHSCAIQISPSRREHRFMRLEWNPAQAQNAQGDAMQLLTDTLSACIPSYTPQMLLNANITRIDLTFDIRRIPIDSLLVFYDILRKPVSEQYFTYRGENGPMGRLNAMTIGRNSSPRQLVVYDKNLERKIRQIGEFPGLEWARTTRPTGRRRKSALTRFELRCRDVGAISNLVNIENPFESYSVRSYTQVQSMKDGHVWQWLIDSAKARGAQAALSLIENRRERTKYANALREASAPSWWAPADIWSELPMALRRALDIKV